MYPTNNNKMTTVFISSTSQDLSLHRQVARDVVLACRWHPIMMEYMGTRPKSTVEECCKAVAQCDVFILLVAFRRGWVPAAGAGGGDGLRSITAIELEVAERTGKPILVFLADKKSWPIDSCETDDGALSWIMDFRNGLSRMASFFPHENADPRSENPLPGFSSKVREACLNLRERLMAQGDSPSVNFAPSPVMRQEQPAPEKEARYSEAANGIPLHAPPSFGTLPARPYPILEPYSHPSTFAGRNRELAEVMRLISLSKLLLCVHAPSGTGKSSFLQAGLRPMLWDKGYAVAFDRMPDELGVARRLLADLIDSPAIDRVKDTDYLEFFDYLDKVKKRIGRPPILILDQFEDTLRRQEGRALKVLGPLLAATARRLPGNEGFVCQWILVYRQEYHGAVVEWLRNVLREVKLDASHNGGPATEIMEQLPCDLFRQDRFHEWPLPFLGDPGFSNAPLEAARKEFLAVITKPIDNEPAREYYNLRFAPGNAEKLAAAFAIERIQSPRAPLAPQLQVILAHLLESRLAADDPTIYVPDDPQVLIQNALSKYLRRKLDEAFVGQPDDRRRRLRTQALFVLRQLADAKGQRGQGIPSAELRSSLGPDGSFIMRRLESPNIRLVLQDDIAGIGRYILPHDEIAKIVQGIFKDPKEQAYYDIDDRLVELRRIISRRAELSRAGDMGALELDDALLRRIKEAESALLWDENARQWWENVLANHEKKNREQARRRTTERMVLTSLALATITIISLIAVFSDKGLKQIRYEGNVRQGPMSEAALAVYTLSTKFRLPGSDLWELVKDRRDLKELLASGLPAGKKALTDAGEKADDEFIPEMIEKAYFSGEQETSLIGAMLFTLDNFAPDQKDCLKVRARIIADLRHKHAPPPYVDADWDLISPPEGKDEISFDMGCNPDAELNGECREGELLHRVRLSPYRLLRHEVTVEEYRQFDPAHQQKINDPKTPVTDVDWYQAYAYAAWQGASLPTEAQFECAARAGTSSSWPTGNVPAELKNVAVYDIDSRTGTVAQVMSRQPNSWGLYDMQGNVEEWCLDWWGAYPREELKDPQGPKEGKVRVARGGDYSRRDASSLRSAARSSHTPEDQLHYLGFRVALSTVPVP
ncbi:MAG TPA: SUMF1/EgtB/PvdO family nonheme iron enzyme [Blastocatellia bacterium]|nr:SUMF1/EgtB/PvdO family nonheme iron enzyme [Blastocatellia bacterium]